MNFHQTRKKEIAVKINRARGGGPGWLNIRDHAVGNADRAGEHLVRGDDLSVGEK